MVVWKWARRTISPPFSRKFLLPRSRPAAPVVGAGKRRHRLGELLIQDELHSAKLDGRELELTPTEFAILKLLAAHPGRVFTRNQIIGQVKGQGYPVTERAIDVQIVNLRRKLGDWGANIDTVRGVGYRMKPGDQI